MTTLIALLCRITIAVAAEILHTIEPHHRDFQAWEQQLEEEHDD